MPSQSKEVRYIQIDMRTGDTDRHTLKRNDDLGIFSETSSNVFIAA